MKKLKDKGFTLIEVLATITILGIITATAIPIINNARYEFANKKYDMYKESVETAAKLYVDAYEIDVFGYETSGCRKIMFSELKNKKLIEDISEPYIDCARSGAKETYVIVRKNNGTYSYEASMECIDKSKNNAIAYSNIPSSSC